MSCVFEKHFCLFIEQETLIPSGQKENCGCTIKVMPINVRFQKSISPRFWKHRERNTHTDMLCVVLHSIEWKIHHTSLAKLHSILRLIFMPYISVYVARCVIHRQNKVNFSQIKVMCMARQWKEHKFQI